MSIELTIGPAFIGRTIGRWMLTAFIEHETEPPTPTPTPGYCEECWRRKHIITYHPVGHRHRPVQAQKLSDIAFEPLRPCSANPNTYCTHKGCNSGRCGVCETLGRTCAKHQDYGES